MLAQHCDELRRHEGDQARLRIHLAALRGGVDAPAAESEGPGHRGGVSGIAAGEQLRRAGRGGLDRWALHQPGTRAGGLRCGLADTAGIGSSGGWAQTGGGACRRQQGGAGEEADQASAGLIRASGPWRPCRRSRSGVGSARRRRCGGRR